MLYVHPHITLSWETIEAFTKEAQSVTLFVMTPLVRQWGKHIKQMRLRDRD